MLVAPGTTKQNTEMEFEKYGNMTTILDGPNNDYWKTSPNSNEIKRLPKYKCMFVLF